MITWKYTWSGLDPLTLEVGMVSNNCEHQYNDRRIYQKHNSFRKISVCLSRFSFFLSMSIVIFRIFHKYEYCYLCHYCHYTLHPTMMRRMSFSPTHKRRKPRETKNRPLSLHKVYPLLCPNSGLSFCLPHLLNVDHFLLNVLY